MGDAQLDQHDLVERLVALGLDEREAKLYLHLALGGPSRASDAATATRLKRTETYRALEGLMRRGFVTAHLAKPVVYEANSPDAVFGDLLASHEQRRADIERVREQVTDAVATARTRADRDSGRHGYKIIQGRRAILHHVETMFRHAEHHASLASTTLSTASITSQNRAWQTLVRRGKEGLPIRLLIRDTPGMAGGVAPVHDAPNVRMRTFDPARPVRFVVVDGREVVCWLVNDPTPGIEGRDDVAMWTNAPDFIHAQEHLFEALWREGRDLPRLVQRDVRVN